MRTLVRLSSALLLLSACTPAPSAPQRAASAARPAANPLTPRLVAIDNAVPSAPQSSAQTSAPQAQTPDPALIRGEVMLARARFSPGVIDGRDGTNLHHALAAYQAARGLAQSGAMDAATWRALLAEPGASRPVVEAYVVTAADMAGPFAPDVGEDFVKLAALPQGPLYSSPLEALAERFHMSQALLSALNPGVDFRHAGVAVVVADAAPLPFSKGDVEHVEVSKADASVTAYGAGDQVLAFYPATVGSTERPSPTGMHKVRGVSFNPDYVYDPAKLHWGPRSHGRLTIKPGPNGPVGVVWIDLNAPSYGIHGSPDPDKIGKTASHGCVRLTNWDAMALAGGVKPGVEVDFVGERGEA